MGIIPAGDESRELSKLRNRFEAALDQGMEWNAEFARSKPWEDLSEKIVATCLCFANTRGGGILVIGVEESDGGIKHTGVIPEHLSTYDADAMYGHINGFASTALSLKVVTFTRSGNPNPFVVIEVEEFARLPVVYRKDSKRFRRGDIVLRGKRLPECHRVEEEGEMLELLELALEKMHREFMERARRLGLAPPQADDEAYDAELGDLKP